MKDIIERCVEWQPFDSMHNTFEKHWQPVSWGENRSRRFLFVRQFNAEQRKEPLQLDLFEQLGYCSDFKVVITNRRDSLVAKAVLTHKGRGAQEGFFAELKSENALAYVPTKTWLGPRVLCAVLIAHSLTGELTMLCEETSSSVHDAQRAPQWTFTQIDTLRRELLQRAGRLIRPQGKLTLSMRINKAVKSRIEAAIPSHSVSEL